MNMAESKKKVYLRRFLQVMIMVCLTLLCFHALGVLMKQKHTGSGDNAVNPGFHAGRGIYEGIYYLPDDTLDVLCLGSSHTFCTVAPLKMWKDYGITSYDAASSGCSLWQSYYYLEDVLRTQSPEVVLLEVLTADITEPQDEAFNREVLDDMRWGKAKLGLIRTSCRMNPQGEYVSGYLFPLLRYHDRWSELTEADYHYFQENGYNLPKGYVALFSRNKEYTFDPSEFEHTDPHAELPEENQRWLDRIRSLCEREGAKLVLFYAPTISKAKGTRSAEVRNYARKRGLPYLDFNADEKLQQAAGIDFTQDIAEDGGHMNYWGAMKFSDYMGSWLTENYDLTDKRKDPAYQSWNDDTEEFSDEISAIFTEE